MRLLITRPEPDASLSADRLRALGHEVIVAPVMETVFSAEPLGAIDGYDFIVTSRNGLRALSPLVDQTVKKSATLYAVGDATASLAAAEGFQIIRSAAGAVDDLVTLIQAAEPHPLAYVCGRERKGNLDEKLKTRGRNVRVFERYYADFVRSFPKPVLDAMKADEVDGVLLYSERTARAYKALIEHHKFSQSTNLWTHFCLAKSVASVFDASVGLHLIVAKEPNEQSLFEAVERGQV